MSAPQNSTKSLTNTTRPRPFRKPRLYQRVAIKRGPSLHLIEEADLKYYWAAYRKGVFDLPVDLAQEVFTEQVTTLAQTKPTYTLVADHPVGVATLDYFQGYAWPEIIWFPWATPRQIVETSVYALREGLRDAPLMFFVEDARFCIQMRRYSLNFFLVGEAADKRKIYERRKW